MSKIIVTGGSGFVGQHLIKLLKEQGHQVVDYSIQGGMDILNYEQFRTVLDILRPDKIFHLAGQAYVPESFTNPDRVVKTNVIGSLNLFEAVRQLGIKPKILVAGSSEEYGDAGVGGVEEKTLPIPRSPYAVSKWAMGQLARIYSDVYGLHIVHTRAYNHTGPGRGEMYAESTFARQIVEIERGERDVLKHGNLDTVRNYTDVRDVVEAYTLAIDLEPGTYNICSDHNLKIAEMLDILVKASKSKIKLEVDQARYRPGDFSFNPPSCEKFKKLTGWKTKIPIKQTFVDLLAYWRDKL